MNEPGQIVETSPLRTALDLYITYGRTSLDFSKQLWDHLQNGFVFSTPWHFLMARAVMLDDGRQAWLVSVGVGPLEELLAFVPFRLDWIAFQRRNQPRLRVYNFDRFISLCRKLKDKERCAI